MQDIRRSENRDMFITNRFADTDFKTCFNDEVAARTKLYLKYCAQSLKYQANLFSESEDFLFWPIFNYFLTE